MHRELKKMELKPLSPRRYHWLLLLLALLLSHLASAELTITTDRQTIAADESLQMVLRYDGQVLSGEPELGVLLRDWEIISNNRNQQYSWVNGESISYTEWQLTLMPRTTGTLLIPSVRFKNDISNALEIEVVASRAASSVAQTIFAESSVDIAEVYPQQQIIFTARLYSASRLSDLALTELNIDNAIIERINENQYQKSIGGRAYSVVEVQYALFPSQVGELVIPPLRFSGYEVSGRSSFFNRGNRIIRTTESQTVVVKPLPSGQQPTRWIPAQQLQLEQQWSQPPEQLTLGEPITRTIILRARGLTGAQLPPLPSADNNGYKSYPDQPKITESIDRTSVVGQRIESVAIVPQQSGELLLPAITVEWWDTAADQARQTTLPATRINVIAPAPTRPALPPTAEQRPPQTPSALTPAERSVTAEVVAERPADRWLQLSLVANALLLALLCALLISQRQRRRSTASQSHHSATTDDSATEQQLWRQIEQQAANQALAPLCETIVAWARQLSNEQISSLTQLAERVASSDPLLVEQLRTLEQAAYSNGADAAPLDTRLLLGALKKNRRKVMQPVHLQPKESALPPLYETT